MYSKEIIKSQIEQFVKVAQHVSDTEHADAIAKHGESFRYYFNVKYGKRYANVYWHQQDKNGEIYTRSAYAFVDLNTGNIMGSDGWGVPNKRMDGRRGNVINLNAAIPFIGPYSIRGPNK